MSFSRKSGLTIGCLFTLRLFLVAGWIGTMTESVHMTMKKLMEYQMRKRQVASPKEQGTHSADCKPVLPPHTTGRKRRIPRNGPQPNPGPSQSCAALNPVLQRRSTRVRKQRIFRNGTQPKKRRTGAPNRRRWIPHIIQTECPCCS